MSRETLNVYISKLGEMTSEEALELAIGAEKIAKDCGKMDIAYNHFKREQALFEEYALLLERFKC